MQQMLRGEGLTSFVRGHRARASPGEGGLAWKAVPSAAQPLPPGQGSNQAFRLPFCGQPIPFFACW